jgi:hypothetical protein
MWMNQVIYGAAFGNNIRFQNYQLIITAPDGTNTTVPFAVVSDPTSAQDYYFTPTAVGTYTLTFNFPGQLYDFPVALNFLTDLTNVQAGYETIPWSSATAAHYEPASASCTITVQSATVSPLPSTPLPTAFWTRPIYGENSNWFTIASNWLGDVSPGYTGFAGTYNGGGNGETLAGANDVVGSLTSHVMWTKPLESGGIVGNNQTVIQGDSYFEGSAYSQRYTNPIIVDGLLFYTEPVSFNGVPGALSNTWGYGPTDCVNLVTGQLVWSEHITGGLGFAYVYDVQDANQHGVYPPILFSVAGGQSLFGWAPMTWTAYDAWTGDYMFTVSGIPVGSATATALGPNGEFLVIDLANLGTPTSPNWYLQEWNSSRLWTGEYNGPSTSPTVIPSLATPGTSTVNGANPLLYDFNVSAPFLNSAYGMVPLKGVGAIVNNVFLAESGNLPSLGADFMGPQSDTPYTYFTLNIDQATPTSLGTVIWHQTETPPAGNITVLEAGIDPVNRVFVEDYRETQQYVGYSLDTGARLWGPTVAQAQLDYYGSPASGSLANVFAYGKMYSSAYAGIVYCYDTKTGDILWTYGNGGEGNTTNSGVETPFAHYPTFVQAIGGGVVYLMTTEHTEETPIFKGATASAINATTGKLIWQISDYTGEFLVMSYAAADGYNTWFNGYDDQIYVVGRGPSQTTVCAPSVGVTTATPVVIQGSVTDISAGTKQTEQAADFPNGVPCASDASMTQWMGYVYQQQPEPTNFTGVQVQLAVLDSNGNHYPIGTATTDESGTYSLTWTPPIPGNFTIYATFAGTNGYWPSYAETHLYAGSPPPTPAPTASPPSGLASTGSLELGIAAVIIVIVIIGAVLAILMLRKKP